MLQPAVLYADEIKKEFAKRFYTEEMYYYVGWAHCQTELLTHDTLAKCENKYCYASVDMSGETPKLIGYIDYQIEPETNCACKFGIISFDKGNPTFGVDVFNTIKKLIHQVHRIEWRMVGGNPVKKHYDKLCEMFNGNIVCLHDTAKDNNGNYRDSYIYEILTDKIPEKYRNEGKERKDDYESVLTSIAESYGFGTKIFDAVSRFIIKNYCVKFDLSDPSICDVGNMLSSDKFRDGIRKAVMNVSPEYSIDEDGDEFDVVYSADGVHERFTVDSALIADIILKLWNYYVPE